MKKESILLKITVLTFSATLAGCMIYKMSKTSAPDKQPVEDPVELAKKPAKRAHLSGSKSLDSILMKRAYSNSKNPSKGNGAGNGSSTRTGEDFIQPTDFSNRTKEQP